MVDIYINGVKRTLLLKHITYNDLCALEEINPVYSPSITWCYNNSQGILTYNKSIELKENMIFNINITGAA